MSRTFRFQLSFLVVLLAAISSPRFGDLRGAPQEAAAVAAKEKPKPILDYISGGWDTLTRSMSECTTVVDSKMATISVLYVPADFKIPDAMREMEKRCGLEIRPLPQVIQKPGEISTNIFSPHGLLYLPNHYVVPGGRFNEMYGWDSYFIIRGLVRSGRIELARGMVENFFYEIDHYGSILNANRTYYLSRSQPPFLTSMIFSVYNAQKEKGNVDRAWLERAYGYAVRDHEMWSNEPLLAGTTGLSRYFDFGEGPAPESLKDESDHYRKVINYFLSHSEVGHAYLKERNPGENESLGPGTEYVLRLCDMPKTMERPHCEAIRELSLTGDYYKGDRAMRESGFDISFRFGPFGADTHHFAPVCLNSLLYKTEMDLAEMSELLGHKQAAENWKKLANERRVAINKYLWDAQRGEFFDYDTIKQARSSYEYITTYYPLFAGLATPEQAKAVVANLKSFEQPGGAVMSPYTTGAQWDSPYAWAPTQMILADGLRNYGYKEEAARIAYKFAGTIADNYAKQGYIVEKYNAIERSTDSATSSGYQINVIGFGWTNAAFLDFLQELPPAKRAELTRAAH